MKGSRFLPIILALSSPCLTRTITLTCLVMFNRSARGEFEFEVLHYFSGPIASAPNSIIEATDGRFYGTTGYGGEFGDGTVFEFDPPDDFIVLHSFSGGDDGDEPNAGLIEGQDGSFYGTTTFGGAFGAGTIYKIDPLGNFTTLHSFTWDGPDGYSPRAALIEASDGDFYGTAVSGGAGFFGTVFKITPTGWFTLLRSFSFGGPDGANPSAALIEVSDGIFYGTTEQGGTMGMGTVFKIDERGGFLTLKSFTGADGTLPQGALIEASDGNFYGMTAWGGKADEGTIFRITPTGNLTTFHSFGGGDGKTPVAALMEASDGSFYGTTYRGGEADCGTIFKITPAGDFTTLHSFRGDDGRWPAAELIEAWDGSFYGTTSYGGDHTSGGVLFRLRHRESSLSFLRGDCNADGAVDISDAMAILFFQFMGGDLSCVNAADVDDNGLNEVTDVIYHLTFLFLGGPSPEEPFGECGEDPTIDELTCESFASCE